MATIPCSQFFYQALGTIPLRATRSNPDSLENRWGNFFYNFDLSTSADDDELGPYGAWSMGDLPVSHAAQIDDARGDDMINVAIIDRVYVLDWTRFQDEWDYNQVAPIYRMLRLGPIPHSADAVEDGVRGYAVDQLKRFREFRFDLKRAPQVPTSNYRITVAEAGNETNNQRSKRFLTRLKNRARIALKGLAFIVAIEHSANEQFMPLTWSAMWEVLGKRVRRSRVAS